MISATKLTLTGAGLAASVMALPFVGVAQVGEAPSGVVPKGLWETFMQGGEKGILSVVCVVLVFALVKSLKYTQGLVEEVKTMARDNMGQIQKNTDALVEVRNVLEDCKKSKV